MGLSASIAAWAASARLATFAARIFSMWVLCCFGVIAMIVLLCLRNEPRYADKWREIVCINHRLGRPRIIEDGAVAARFGVIAMFGLHLDELPDEIPRRCCFRALDVIRPRFKSGRTGKAGNQLRTSFALQVYRGVIEGFRCLDENRDVASNFVLEFGLWYHFKILTVASRSKLPPDEFCRN